MYRCSSTCTVHVHVHVCAYDKYTYMYWHILLLVPILPNSQVLRQMRKLDWNDPEVNTFTLHIAHVHVHIHAFPCLSYVFPCLPYLAYITLDLNPASWAASVAQLAEHWTSNPVVTGSNPVRGSSVFFSLSAFGLCLTLSCLPLHIHVQDLIIYMYMYMYSTVMYMHVPYRLSFRKLW